MEKSINLQKAQDIIINIPANNSVENVPIQRALNRVIAEDFAAIIPSPTFPRSAFDGYAFRSEDVKEASVKNPIVLKINQEIPAGCTAKCPVGPGEAAKILTGAPIPEGANAITKFEATEFDEEYVKIFEPIEDGLNIITIGEDIPEGTPLIPKGSVITPAMLGVMASQGLTEIGVIKKPKIAMVTVGSELAPLGAPLPPAMIYNSNMYALQGYIEGLGAEFSGDVIVPDDHEVILDAINKAYDDGADMIITTGGASTGDYDCAYRTAEASGGEILYWKLAIRPGGALLVYVLKGKLVLSLSGNPGAAAIGLLLLGLPYIRKLAGRNDLYPEEMTVKLKNSLTKDNPITRVIRGYLEIVDGEAYFVEEGKQGGGDLSSLINCNLIAEIPKGTPRLEAGSLVKAYKVE